MASEPVVAPGPEYTHRQLLERAREEALARGLDDVLIVDSDFHQVEAQSWLEIIGYLDNEVIRHYFETGSGNRFWYPADVAAGGTQSVGGRILSQEAWTKAAVGGGAEGDLARIREAMDMLMLDYVVVFPTNLLTVGTNPLTDLETHVARAYARWLCERLLCEDRRILAMLHLPFNDPAASLRLIEEFGDTPGVVGFMVTSARHAPIYHRDYMPVYAALEERRKPIAFHLSFNYYERSQEQLASRFISFHSLASYYHMIQATNWVVHGIPERFPGIKAIFIEGGLAWIPFVMQRLDHNYLMRPSEAPLLTRKPSEYLRELYYTSQPMERTDPVALEFTLNMIHAETQLLYASDWPHWDFDLPSTIWDLEFLSDDAKRRILGGNGAELFGLEATLRTEPARA